MNIKEIIKQPEGRRIEFKKILPEGTEWINTIIAFANDAGGELYIGIQDNPRKITGLQEESLVTTEEQVSNTIYDCCYPAILPDITFLTEDDKHIIRVTVYRGSALPYYRKDKGKLKGTYIRVGSSNRLADEEIIAELERRKRNVSFDCELVMDKLANELNIETFKKEYQEKAGEPLDIQTLHKLELTRKMNDAEYPTNALVLFSDDDLRRSIFYFAKVECARFKGTTPDEFIDQKSITSNIATQTEEAYNFVLRHINEGATVEGVYTVSRWEYPIKAVREVIRNAVVHRDYSLTGKDVKVAIYDDMIEVTSPGLLPPSIDYAAMESRQSDARNKVIAPVFKRMGIIDQWGNGLKLIANELKEYPQIDFRWREVGLSFQVQFVKLNYVAKQELDQDTMQDTVQVTMQDTMQVTMQDTVQDTVQVTVQDNIDTMQVTMQVKELIKVLDKEMYRQDIQDKLNLQNRNYFRLSYLKPALEQGLVEMTAPEKRNSKLQKYRLTALGKQLKEKFT
ncbi:MAG: putative DNA binding domain-containing protein [Tannerellaceae bacterium]|nr:putative DNA binding domain-containing protein [Tannerellaceae bacterium]